MNTGQVLGSHGEVIIDMATGLVQEYTAVDSDFGYSDIVKFDLDEYFTYYPNELRSQTTEFDILDLGYWLKGGAYEPPVKEFREEIKPHVAGMKVLR